jgi:hypothetical protein
MYRVHKHLKTQHFGGIVYLILTKEQLLLGFYKEGIAFFL